MESAAVKEKIEYTIFLVNDFAKKHALSHSEAFNYLDRFGAIGFIERNYNIAHTLAFSEMVENLTAFCRKNGGKL